MIAYIILAGGDLHCRSNYSLLLQMRKLTSQIKVLSEVIEISTQNPLLSCSVILASVLSMCLRYLGAEAGVPNTHHVAG